VAGVIYHGPDGVPFIRSHAASSDSIQNATCVSRPLLIARVCLIYREESRGKGRGADFACRLPSLPLRDLRRPAWFPEEMEATGMISGVPTRQEGRRLWQYLASISGIWATCVRTFRESFGKVRADKRRAAASTESCAKFASPLTYSRYVTVIYV